jgi:hypothetical protein
VAYHFNWSFDQIIDMTHSLRKTFVDEIASINRRLSTPSGAGDMFGGLRIFGTPPSSS